VSRRGAQMSQYLASLLDHPSSVLTMAQSAVPHLPSMTSSGLCNLLALCCLTRVFHAPLFNAAWADDVLRRLPFSAVDRELLHHVNVALGLHTRSDVPGLPADVGAHCKQAWSRTFELQKRLHEPVAASMRRQGLKHDWNFDSSVGYTAWIAVIEPKVTFMLDVDTPQNYIAGSRSASLARRLFVSNLESAGLCLSVASSRCSNLRGYFSQCCHPWCRGVAVAAVSMSMA
jgi:hypothetical protein